MSDTLRLTEFLIAKRSLTPCDDGAQALIAQRLEALGFQCETMSFGPENAPVSNLWAHRAGTGAGPCLVFAGHTDVVPTGPLDQWHSDPFIPTHRDGLLFGRGAADMKASLAAMVVACEEFVRNHEQHRGSLAFLITSDEEGPSIDGTQKVCDALAQRGVKLDYCIVGEPTSVAHLGDTIKNGRRGSLSARLTILGKQGHIAYPHLARNPIHLAAPALAELAAIEWDSGNEYFPPTSWQMSNIHAGTGAGNVIPGELHIDFNFRFATSSTPDSLKQRVEAVLKKHGLDYRLEWVLGGEPFVTPKGALVQAVSESIAQITGAPTQLSTTGGTSDGRFIAKICPQVLEFGPVNASIHQIDEHVRVADLERLKDVYRLTLERLIA